MNLNKGIAPIMLIVAVAIFGLISIPVMANIEEVSAPTMTPQPTESPIPTELPTPSSTQLPTASPEVKGAGTIDYSGTGNFEERSGNSYVKIESNSGTNTVHVESSGNSSSEVTITNKVN